MRVQKKIKKIFPGGFTLIEVLLVLALLVLIAATVGPVAWSLSERNDLDLSAIIIAQSLRAAQTFATAVDQDTPWGVELQSQDVVVFSGSSFAGRNSNFDQVLNFPQAVASGGLTEIDFNKFSGQPQTSGSFVITDPLGQSRTISVNAAGMVSY